jgi:hypothetical protein
MLGGNIVDNFMDKLAEKISAQDIIRANAQAEAMEAERTKQEAEQFKTQLEELRENEKEHRAVIEAAKDSIEAAKTSIEETGKTVSALSEKLRENETALSEKLRENETALSEKLRENEAAISEKLHDNEVNVHDVGVQVYRNVQAVVEKNQERNSDDFKEQARRLEAIQIAIESKNNAVLPVLIITLLVAGADLVLNILRILGVL